MLSINGFTFNDRHCSEFDLSMRTRNNPLLPQKRVTEQVVIGRNSSYKFEDGYSDKIIEIECTFLERNIGLRRQKARGIAKWLSQKGNLILDTEPDKFYKAYLANQVDLSIMANFDTFTLMFVCEPFAFSVMDSNDDLTWDSPIIFESDYTWDDEGNDNVFTITESQDILVYNMGTVEALPIIEITGTATKLVIGPITINNINKKTIVDCDNYLCYTLDGEARTNKLKDCNSTDFIELQSGNNTIQVAGTDLNCTIKFVFNHSYL